jgi:hypothetical protein
MEIKEIQSQIQAQSILFNRTAYIAMLMVAMVFLFLKDWSQATIFSGLSLVFDPFDQTVTFKKRPLWQRTWLIVHTIAVFILFSILLFGK